MAFLIDSLKEKFGVKEDEIDGFSDMNYAVGNTSGLDVGQIPTPIAQRVGDQAQIGGSVMEVKISNPSTFQIEKPELVNTIEQLGIDISLHSEMSVGYCSPYKTRGTQSQGFEPVHDYFTRYLRELARFKNEVETREDLTFNISRINPHASTSLLPPTDERMASDVGLDPFGYEISELEDSPRPGSGKNIYDNPEFMKKFYHTFILDEVNEPYQIYQLFSRFSPKFRDQYWRESQAKACNNFWEEIEDFATINGFDQADPIQEKIAMLQSVRMADQGVGSEWREIFNKKTLNNSYSLGGDYQELNSLAGAWEFLASFAPEENPLEVGNFDHQKFGRNALQSMDACYYELKKVTNSNVDTSLLPEEIPFEQIVEDVIDSLEKAMDRLWKGSGDDLFLISVQAKLSALNSRLDIQETEILERAQSIEEDELEDAVEKVISGEEKDEFFEVPGDSGKTPSDEYEDMLDSLMNSFEQSLWMESNLYYRIIPAWMTSATNSTEDHEGWSAPEFIWKAIVERRWGDEIDIDFTDPFKENGYFENLYEKREFMMDVAAASAACYIWGHFTQKKSEFRIEDDEYLDDIYTRETWVEWMNRFGIGVNLETMAGSSQELFKLWRPKDIAVAARAINMTADKIFNEKDMEWNEELHGSIAKFTIDMEHVASLGADPWQEMEKFIDQEKQLATDREFRDYNLDIDSDKPLADILRMFHLMKPGVESQQGTRHGPFVRGDMTLYTWLYKCVEAGFTRTGDGEKAYVMFEQADEKAETTYTTRIAMDMIQLGLKPSEVSPDKVDPSKRNYESKEEALIARFFGMDKAGYNREWAKIEENAFAPLEGLLEAEQFDHTFSGKAALENDNRPQEWMEEEYK